MFSFQSREENMPWKYALNEGYHVNSPVKEKRTFFFMVMVFSKDLLCPFHIQ